MFLEAFRISLGSSTSKKKAFITISHWILKKIKTTTYFKKFSPYLIKYEPNVL